MRPRSASDRGWTVEITSLNTRAAATGLPPERERHRDRQRLPDDRGHKRGLERVDANLVENAESHGGGCERESVEAGGLGVIIQVDDASTGVPVEDRDRIFEGFGRGATDGRTDERPGIGLGLAIVARHIEWHHGTIRVQDRPGWRGSIRRRALR